MTGHVVAALDRVDFILCERFTELQFIGRGNSVR